MHLESLISMDFGKQLQRQDNKVVEPTEKRGRMDVAARLRLSSIAGRLTVLHGGGYYEIDGLGRLCRTAAFYGKRVPGIFV